MRPLVIDELLCDLCWSGACGYQVTDNYAEFSIKRIPPEYVIEQFNQKGNRYVRF